MTVAAWKAQSRM